MRVLMCKRKARAEALRDLFTAALLIPSNVPRYYGIWIDLSTEYLINKLNSTATELGVASHALKSRLANLGSMNRTVTEAIPDRALQNNGGKDAEIEPPLQFSNPFMNVISDAMDKIIFRCDELRNYFKSRLTTCRISLTRTVLTT